MTRCENTMLVAAHGFAAVQVVAEVAKFEWCITHQQPRDVCRAGKGTVQGGVFSQVVEAVVGFTLVLEGATRGGV